jgi:hypothetical protein
MTTHRKVRRSVFETNSSSTHSISIASGAETLDTLPVEYDGVCRIFPGEFGWGVETHTDAATKASYALTWAMSCEDYHVWSAAGGRSEETVGNKEEALAMLREVIQEATGCREVVFVGGEEGDDDPWGYIDHQSIEGDGGPGKQAFATKQTLRDFIFKPASQLHICNDNGSCDRCEEEWQRKYGNA